MARLMAGNGIDAKVANSTYETSTYGMIPCETNTGEGAAVSASPTAVLNEVQVGPEEVKRFESALPLTFFQSYPFP